MLTPALRGRQTPRLEQGNHRGRWIAAAVRPSSARLARSALTRFRPMDPGSSQSHTDANDSTSNRCSVRWRDGARRLRARYRDPIEGSRARRPRRRSPLPVEGGRSTRSTRHRSRGDRSRRRVIHTSTTAQGDIVGSLIRSTGVHRGQPCSSSGVGIQPEAGLVWWSTPHRCATQDRPSSRNGCRPHNSSHAKGTPRCSAR